MVSGGIMRMGEHALLVEVAALDDVLALRAALAATRPSGVVDIVPAARTVLVVVDPRLLALSAARAWIEQARDAAGDPAAAAAAAAQVVELPIVYDGADLKGTAALLGITTEELVARHGGAEWSVAFTGFAPGFAYLVSEHWGFDVPRLATPRTRVPAGSVGLAGVFTGAYPRETPGGWRLIGTTPATLFDPAGTPAALLAPGTRVRFRAASAPAPATRSGGDDDGGARRDEHDAGTPPAIRILEPGLLATLQDLGRPGAASLGVALSGALDRSALRTANRLVGNAEDAAAIEVTMGGLRAVANRRLWFAVTGAWGPVRLDGLPLDPYEAHEWPAGARLHIDWFAHGARAYLAVRGGLDGAAALGSRSTDILAGLGQPPLRAGEPVEVRDEATGPIPVPGIAPWGAPHDDELEIELVPGPRDDWFGEAAMPALFESVWTVTGDADRVGIRLDGPELQRVRVGELPSEPMVPGALQVPPSGRPTILLADGPVTGGYPVIAVTTDAARDALAQARPGTRLRFRHAHAAW